MNMTIRTFALTTTLAASVVSAEGYHPHELEPCINGAVSASGRFPSQALENRYGTLRARSGSEPCVGNTPAKPPVIVTEPKPAAADNSTGSAPGC